MPPVLRTVFAVASVTALGMGALMVSVDFLAGDGSNRMMAAGVCLLVLGALAGVATTDEADG